MIWHRNRRFAGLALNPKGVLCLFSHRVDHARPFVIDNAVLLSLRGQQKADYIYTISQGWHYFVDQDALNNISGGVQRENDDLLGLDLRILPVQIIGDDCVVELGV